MPTLPNLGAAELERRRVLRQRYYELVGRKLARLVREYEERHASAPPSQTSTRGEVGEDAEVTKRA